MSGAIIDCAKASPGDLTVEVAIVGSGCGGATAAWELAAAGKDVVVLEEGGDYTGPKLTQRDGQMYDQLYMDRGGRASAVDPAIAVMHGRVLGGGGVINASDVVPLSDAVLRHWQKKYGLTELSPETLAPFRERALKDLSANMPEEGQLNANNTLLRKGAQALGWKGEVMRHNRLGCAGIGTCLIGCPLDRKRNPRFVAIPAAVEAGARFLTLARVVRIDDPTKELKTLQVHRLDEKGYHEGEAFTVKAKVVIVAASAISSPQLFLRSGVGNAHVGQHLSLQPQLPIVATFAEDVRFFRGIPQAYAVTEFEQLEHAEHGWWGFRIEAVAGTPGIVGSLLPEIGTAGFALMQSYPKLAASLLLLPDEPRGAVRVEPSGRLRIDYEIDDEQRARFRQAVKAAARCYFAAGATSVIVPSVPPLRMTSEADLAKIDTEPLRRSSVPYLSAHQQGSMRMAPSERDGATNPDGLVYGTRGVYVFDSSPFPSSASSHTMTPIITVSRYLATKLLSHGW